MERFIEALKDPATGLTYLAVTGVRKQSVEDVERLFGSSVIEFMQKHNYEDEAKYLRVVRNWRRAIDERGIPQDQMEKFMKDFLGFIANELIPWCSENKDFSELEVNRYMHTSCYNRC